MRRHSIWFSPVATLAAATAASAQSPQTQAQRVSEIVAVMQGRRPAAATFDARFLAEVPPEKLTALADQLQAAHGKIHGADEIRAEGAAATFRLHFERATATGRMALSADPPHKVNGFWITSVVPTGDDAGRIAADFAALPGRAGFLVTKLGNASTPIAGANADEQFAVGSAFKLWVLDALAEEIAAGRLRWDQVVRLEARSPPGGITQDWPPRAAVTIDTLATLMISRSDNTATDTLIRLIGRERIDERVRATGHSDPARMLPLLTTAEGFALKLSPAALRDAYARADDAGQARILASLDLDLILAEGTAALDGKPAAIESVEWFASPADIARVLDSLRGRDDPRVPQILAVAPTLPAEVRGRFAYAGYKGGSEAGVLNLTWLLRDKAGAWITVTASWNDAEKPVDEGKLVALSHRLIALIP